MTSPNAAPDSRAGRHRAAWDEHATPPLAARRVQALYYNLFLFEDHLLHYWYMGGPDFYAGSKAPAPVPGQIG